MQAPVQAPTPASSLQRPVREYGTVTPEDRELALSHPVILLTRYGFMKDPNRPALGVFKWVLWAWQIELLMRFAAIWVQGADGLPTQEDTGTARHKRIIILKARQIGVSWLLAGYALWLFLAHPGSRILMISKGQTEAKDLKDKAAFLYDCLPPEFKFPAHPKDSNSNMFFTSAHLGSEIISLADAPGAGRSYTATLVIPDEWAFQDYAADIYGGVEPTLGMYGQLIGVSTANGPSGTFHDIYTAAQKGENDFLPIFLPFNLRPGRTEAWRANEERKFRAAGTPEKTASEYPRTPQEAFASSVNNFFPADLQSAILAGVRAPIREETTSTGTIRWYKDPIPFRKYCMGVDVAKGITGGNFSTFQVAEATTGEVVCTGRFLISPDLWAGVLSRIGLQYNTALLAVEANNHGILTLHTLSKVLLYPNLFFRVITTNNKTRIADEPGWFTTKESKPTMLINLKGALYSGDYVCPDEWFADETQFFIQDGDEPGPIEYRAMQAHTDDSIIAAAITNAVRKFAMSQWRGVRKTAPLSR